MNSFLCLFIGLQSSYFFAMLFLHAAVNTLECELLYLL